MNVTQADTFYDGKDNYFLMTDNEQAEGFNYRRTQSPTSLDEKEAESPRSLLNDLLQFEALNGPSADKSSLCEQLDWENARGHMMGESKQGPESILFTPCEANSSVFSDMELSGQVDDSSVIPLDTNFNTNSIEFLRKRLDEEGLSNELINKIMSSGYQKLIEECYLRLQY